MQTDKNTIPNIISKLRVGDNLLPEETEFVITQLEKMQNIKYSSRPKGFASDPEKARLAGKKSRNKGRDMVK